ncbi:hypothetical protein, partial [Thalassospira sp. UBA4513]|uniref:hypothetical protein n=1 Tax=Thalassospira sp. UBA4513 TaxID=1947675 RepID=UPI00257BDA93
VMHFVSQTFSAGKRFHLRSSLGVRNTVYTNFEDEKTEFRMCVMSVVDAEVPNVCAKARVFFRALFAAALSQLSIAAGWDEPHHEDG